MKPFTGSDTMRCIAPKKRPLLKLNLPALAQSRNLLQALSAPRTVAFPLDLLTQRVGEIMSSIPKLIVLTIFTALVGSSVSIYVIAALAGFFTWPGIATYVRAEMLRVREADYIAAARISGIGDGAILLRHAFPNAISAAYVPLALLVANAILLEASLSFLGIRRDAEMVSWGSIMLDARLYPTAWWLAIFPGLMVTSTVYALYTLSIRSSKPHIPIQ
jgi:peptide/nickel transport system permease protein